jgi:hypothetical protein
VGASSQLIVERVIYNETKTAAVIIGDLKKTK